MAAMLSLCIFRPSIAKMITYESFVDFDPLDVYCAGHRSGGRP